MEPIPGSVVIVTTEQFPACAPKGSEKTILRVTRANHPGVPYYYVGTPSGKEIGLYRNEFVLKG